VALANGAIEDIPQLLSEAESALPIFNPPKKIETFLDHSQEINRRDEEHDI